MTNRFARRVASIGLTAALALTAGLTQAAAIGGTPGQGLACSVSGPEVIAKYSSPQAVSAGGGLQCTSPGATAPGQFGPPPTGSFPAPNPTSGPCHLHYEFPVDFRMAGAPEAWTEGPVAPDGQKIVVNPSSPGLKVDGWHGLNDFGVSSGDYQLAGTQDGFLPFDFVGKWNAQGNCEATQGPGTGWVEGCNGGNTVIVNAVCMDWFPPPAPITGGPIPIGALPIDLTAFVRGQFTGGTISSLPNNPSPGLTNVATCFAIAGMAIQGGGNPLGQQTWEQIVEGPLVPGGEGRHIYYTIVINVSYQDTTWNWGDNSGDAPETAPPACGAAPPNGLLVGHTYRRYSTGGGFPVSVTHHYTVDVTELWDDALGTHSQDFPGAVGPIPVPAAPQPYIKQVIQEEGVPIG